MARREVTGRKAGPASERARKTLAVLPAAYSREAFCEAHHISIAFYYRLLADGLAPDEMAIGRRRLISIESAARWRANREKAAHSQAALDD